MGLAASQARLLSITSRMADNELRSQTINNAKMRLASESALASENYINALNNANMMFTNYAADGTAMTQALTYNALVAYSSYNNQYGLVNSAGQLLVSEDEAKIFAHANGNLNEYLLSHGIEYDTTYFDPGVDGETVRIENENYPTGFDNVEADTLKTWYENYNSYVNSSEYKYYNEYLSQYLDASRAYSGILSYMLDDYIDKLSSDTINTITTADKSTMLSKGQGMIKDLVEKLDNYAIKDKDGNTAFSKLLSNYTNSSTSWVKFDENGNETGTVLGVGVGITSIDSADKEEIGKYTDEKGKEQSLYQYTYPIDYTNKKSVIFEEYYENNTVKCRIYTNYTISGENNHDKDHPISGIVGKTISVNSKNGTTNKYLSAYEMALYTLDSYCESFKHKGDNYGKILDPDGNKISSNYDDTNDNNTAQKMTVVYESGERFAEFLKKYVERITDLAKDKDYFNMSSFGNDVINDFEQGANGEKSAMGLNYGTTINGSGMTYKDYIENFEKAVMAYFGLIEGVSEGYDPDNIQMKDLNNLKLFNEVKENDCQTTYTELTNLDNILKLIKDSEKDESKRIKMTPEFQNIVKACIIDTMIDTYGEPKYAWVDRNDTTNTGNAEAKAQWYTNMFERMSKGYKVLENGLASSPEWLEFALETGIVTMEQVDKSFKWNSIPYSTCTNITEQTNTDALVAKAEAEYNKAMREIEAKDRAFDLELKNIDTEHSSLEKEYDSIKQAIKANIERTMKFDQSS